MASFDNLTTIARETYRVNLTNGIDIANITEPHFEGEQITHFCISTRDDLMTPPGFLPFLREDVVNDHHKHRFNIEEVSEIEQDAIHDLYENAFHDPTLKAIKAANVDLSLKDALLGVDVVSDRNVLRKIMKSCLLLPQHNFYCEKKDFSVHVKFVNNILFLHTVDRFVSAEGGFGRGFNDAIVEIRQQEEGAESSFQYARTSDASYYQVVKSNLDGMTFVTRYQVDAVDEDQNVVELKSRKYPKNPKFRNAPLGTDFYLNIWTQMAMSCTKFVVIGMHDNGRVDKVTKLDLKNIQGMAGLVDVQAKKALGRMTALIRWLKEQMQNHLQGASSGQGVLKYTLSNDRFELMIFEEGVERLPSISPEFEAELAA